MSGVGWVKAATLAVRIVMIVAVLGIPLIAYNKGLFKGQNNKAQAVAESYTKGYSQAMTDHPPQVYTGTVQAVNNNPAPKPASGIGLKLGTWIIGACKA